MTTEGETGRQRRGRLQFLLLVALFFVPLFAAVGWYFVAPQLAPAPAVHGTLIEPARPLEAFTAERAGGGTLELADLRGRWTLVQPVGDACDAVCRERLHFTRQIHDALGEDRVRVRRLVLATGGAATPGLADVLGEHPRLTVVASGPDGPLARQLPAGGPAGTVFVIDPLGNVMMRFGPEVEPDHLLDDLEHLLKVSRIG